MTAHEKVELALRSTLASNGNKQHSFVNRCCGIGRGRVLVKLEKMSVEHIPKAIRAEDLFHHIDMGFLNRRLCLSALPAPLRNQYIAYAKPGTDHMAILSNDHLLVTMLLDTCDLIKAPTLLEALTLGHPRHLFRSTERLLPCPGVYSLPRVEHGILQVLEFGKPVRIAYHTSHIVSDTGRMILAEGYAKSPQSIVGLLHDRPEYFEIEPLVIGTPWFDHPRNREHSIELMWMGQNFGQILPEDILQFSRLTEVDVDSSEEWMDVMRSLPEAKVKKNFASLLADPTKKDWGGEMNDHFSASVMVGGRRRTAAFLLKGPSKFKEMTLDMCGARADQIYRLIGSGADISVVQHAHQIGEVVRGTLRSMTVFPGSPRKYCVIDGQATYRIFKAYGLLGLPSCLTAGRAPWRGVASVG